MTILDINNTTSWTTSTTSVVNSNGNSSTNSPPAETSNPGGWEMYGHTEEASALLGGNRNRNSWTNGLPAQRYNRGGWLTYRRSEEEEERSRRLWTGARLEADGVPLLVSDDEEH